MKKLNAAQTNLLDHMKTGAWIETNPSGSTYTVRKSCYYKWLVRCGTVQPLIQAGLIVCTEPGKYEYDRSE